MTNSEASTFPTGDHRSIQPEYGLTKREYFAGLAMQAIISNAPNGHLSNSKEGVLLVMQWTDELLKQLS